MLVAVSEGAQWGWFWDCQKPPTKQLHSGISGHCSNEGLLLRECSWEHEAKRDTSPFFLHPASFSPDPNRKQLEKQEGSMWSSSSPSITAQCIEWMDLELKDNNLITAAGTFVSSSHNLCFDYMVQPQWTVKGSLRKTSKYNSFIHSFIHRTHIFECHTYTLYWR